MYNDLRADLRLAFRHLWRMPGFSLVAILTLALGIGATTALFSVVYGVLISPYPYARPGEIWVPGVRTPSGQQRMRLYRLGEFRSLEQLPAFSDVMATSPGSALLSGEFAAEALTAIRVSGNAFDFLGVPPLLGRTLQPFDVMPGGAPQPVVVLSYGAWQRLFGGGEALNRTLVLDGTPHTVVGVMPSRFGWWTADGVWLPLGRDSETTAVFPIVRFRPGIDAAAAEQQLHALHTELAAANPRNFPPGQFASTLTNYLDITVASGQLQRSLQLLFSAVGLLLLIACANVANLQLARGSTRSREIAVRLSLGAGRGRVIRQLLTESVLLSLAGGVAGLACAYTITRLMVSLMPTFFVPNESRIEIDALALAFCTIVSVAAGVAAGLAPALQSSRLNPGDALKDESRGSTGLAWGRMRSGLIVAEVAISVMLLGAAAVTMRSFVALQQVDLGFRPEQVVTFQIPLSPKAYATADARNAFARELVDRVRQLPGTAAVTIGNGGLPFGGQASSYAIEGQAGRDGQRILVQLAGDEYLRVLGVPLLKGRMFTAREAEAADRIAVINEAAAALWNGADPIGRRLRLDALTPPAASAALVQGAPDPEVTIVGIIGNTRNDGVQAEPQPAVTIPYTVLAPPQRILAVRGAGELAPLIGGIRAVVRVMDPLQPIGAPRTVAEMLDRQFAQPRFTMALFGVFAGLGLAVATAGLYSVLSYLVSLRTREIGIRIALGARRRDIIQLICLAGGRLVAFGFAAGLLGMVLTSDLLGSQLQLSQGSTDDPKAYLGVALAVGTVALIACLVPARRASRVAPVDAMR